MKNQKITLYGLIALFAISLSVNTRLKGQSLETDYTLQIDAFKQSFVNKKIDDVKGYLSPELKLGPLPAEKTIPLLTNVLAQFPPMNKMEIIKNGVGVAFINYDFDGLGMSESFVYFDTGGQITKIDLLDETIEKGIRLQRRLLTSVKYPAPGELGKIYPFQKVEFESKDGLLITGNLYEIDPKKPTILLCHQATFNKFEYTDIAPKLNQLGFNCLAIDQRSGGPMAEHYNETYLRAIDQEKSTEYLEAEKDILASVDFLRKKFKKKIIIWGSSYSSTLSLFVAADHKAVSGVIAFSPSDLFRAKRAPLEEV